MPSSSKKKPLVIVTRKLPDAIETRLMELFETRLNTEDRPFDTTQLVEAVRTAILGKHVAHCQAGQREQIAERLLIFDPAEPALGRPRSRGLGLCGRRSKIWAEQDQQSHQTNQQPSQQPSTASPPAQPAARRRRLWATGE